MTAGPILVYSDQAARTSTHQLLPLLRASFPGRTVSTADTPAVTAAVRDGTAAAIVIPGICGDTSVYYECLGGDEGQRRLKDFVENGGLLITACAGSYLISRRTEYEPFWGPSKQRINAAPLFNATARGPVPGAGTLPDDPCTTVSVSWRDADGSWRQAQIAYGNGPALYPEEAGQDIHILARYDDVAGQPPAAVWLNHGKGAVLWLGILPHLGYQAPGVNQTVKMHELMQRLKAHETERTAFWNVMMRRADAHLRGQNPPALAPPALGLS